MKKDKLVKRDNKKEILKKDLKKISGGREASAVTFSDAAELLDAKKAALPKGKIIR